MMPTGRSPFATRLLLRVGSFELRRWPHFLTFAAGFGAMSFMVARALGKLHGGLL